MVYINRKKLKKHIEKNSEDYEKLYQMTYMIDGNIVDMTPPFKLKDIVIITRTDSFREEQQKMMMRGSRIAKQRRELSENSTSSIGLILYKDSK